MSMQLRIVHSTHYEYAGPAVASYNQARLTPLTTPEQIVVHSRLEVSPQPWTYEYRDYFGSHVIAFEVLDPHSSMTVTATSTVQVNRAPTPAPSASWEELASREVADRWTEYLVLPSLVAPAEDLAGLVKEIAAGADLPGTAAREVCALVAGSVEYRSGSTDVSTTAAGAWEQRAGVCQDMAHVALGALRSVGIPARYVSGYFHPAPAPEVGTPTPGDSHAWVEWWDHGWHPYDVTSSAEPDDRYVVLATGRDYNDVKPVSGIYSGPPTTDMTVSVEVTRLS
jgi:transglutaminase-like putative cysteine protease